MYIMITTYGVSGVSNSIVITCPHCGKGGTFSKISEIKDFTTKVADEGSYVMGQRECPNSKCRAHIFFVRKPNRIITYPPIKIDFDVDNIPPGIRSTLEEAIVCHSQECYVASAIMVRRTLEELCEDKECKGKTLQDRIAKLKDNVVLPQGLLGALDQLRLLGNDAAHIKSNNYDQVGDEEVSIGIDIVKEILKSVYQLDSLVQRLIDLKKS